MPDDDRRRDEDSRQDGDDLIYIPRLRLGPRVAHYYGDHVRKLFIGAAAVSLILAPFFSNYLPFTLPFEILGAIVLIVLAALTNPKNELVMLANAAAAAIGVVANETIALFAYLNGEILIFSAREALAFIFVFALYFSLKTVRAMQLGQIGKREPPGEFYEDYMEEKIKENRRNL